MKIFEFNPIRITGKCNFNNVVVNLISIFTLIVFIISSLLYAINHKNVDFVYYPLIFSTLIFGIPHGAADHLFLWGFTKKSSIKFKSISILIYLSIAIMYMLIWFIYPYISLFFFIILTIYHWGKADFIYGILSRRVIGINTYLNTYYSIYRGVIPILTPGILYNTEYNEFINGICNIINDSSGFNLQINSFILVSILSMIIISFNVTIIYCEKLKGGFKLTKFDHIESLLLVIWFLCLPPIYSIGVYFIFWHSLRHITRILYLDKHTCYLDGTLNYKRISIRYIQLFSFMTILALSFFIYFLYSQTSDFYKSNIVHALLILISTLTLPHAITVYLMDIKQLKYVYNKCKQ